VRSLWRPSHGQIFTHINFRFWWEGKIMARTTNKTRGNGPKQPVVTIASPQAHDGAIDDQNPPESLSDAAKAEWMRVSQILHERNVFDQLDVTSLADYCLCFDRLRQCEQEITDRGVLVAGRDGNLVKNPALAAAKSYRDALQKWVKAFGMSIGARKQVSMPGPGKPERVPNRFQQFRAEGRTN
jgi:P27 family predicted phage terminase small subunit